jgi:hypothetical protein
MVRITGQRRPDRDTIGGSSADRDYRMSRHVNAMYIGIAEVLLRGSRLGAAGVPKRRTSFEELLAAFSAAFMHKAKILNCL